MKFLTVFILMAIPLMDNPTGEGSEYTTVAGQYQKPVLSFGIIADVQYADAEPAGTRYYRSSAVKLKEAVTSFGKDSVDFVITLGDLIDKELKSYDPVLDILESSGLKFYHVTGNHDYSVDRSQKNRLPDVYFKKPGYYSFSISSFRFVFLNGNEISTYSTRNRKKITPDQNGSPKVFTNNKSTRDATKGSHLRITTFTTPRINNPIINAKMIPLMVAFSFLRK